MDELVDVKAQVAKENSSICATMHLPIRIGPIGTVRDASFLDTLHRATGEGSLIIQTRTESCLLVLRLNESSDPSSSDGSTSSKQPLDQDTPPSSLGDETESAGQ